MQHSTRNRSNFNISSENSNTNNDDDKNIAQRFHALNELNNKLQQDKNRKEASLEQVNIQLEECKKQALEEFGVSTIEELLALIEETEKEENIKYDNISSDLKVLEQALRQVDENIKNENSFSILYILVLRCNNSKERKHYK